MRFVIVAVQTDQYIQSPIFVLNSGYDAWQVCCRDALSMLIELGRIRDINAQMQNVYGLNSPKFSTCANQVRRDVCAVGCVV
jgi:hypothetical protein